MAVVVGVVVLVKNDADTSRLLIEVIVVAVLEVLAVVVVEVLIVIVVVVVVVVKNDADTS